MGKWNNAPVVYVIVQVRFSAVLALPSYLSEIQEHFRKSGFPSFAPRFNFQLGFSVPQANNPEAAVSPIPIERTPAYVFSNRDNSQSFILEQNGLTFHVTDYEDFAWFLDRFLRPLEFISDVMKPDSSERIGLRYIDAIRPQEGRKIPDYLIPEVLGLSQKPLEGSLQHSYSENMFVNNDISTVSRVLVRGSGPIALPPDALSFPIATNSRLAAHKGPYATVDTDSFHPIPSPMDLAKIRSILVDLHAGLEAAFRNVVTDFALSEWK